jgi:hypothetical protein
MIGIQLSEVIYPRRHFGDVLDICKREAPARNHCAHLPRFAPEFRGVAGLGRAVLAVVLLLHVADRLPGGAQHGVDLLAAGLVRGGF